MSLPFLGESVEIHGQVLYVEPRMGFALKFDTLTPAQITALAAVLGDPPKSIR